MKPPSDRIFHLAMQILLVQQVIANASNVSGRLHGFKVNASCRPIRTNTSCK